MSEINKPIDEFNTISENIVINTSNHKINEWANYLNFYNNNESKNNLEALSNIPIYSQIIVIDKKENYALLQLDGAFKNFLLQIEKGINQTEKMKIFLFFDKICLLTFDLENIFTLPLIDLQVGQYHLYINETPALDFKIVN